MGTDSSRQIVDKIVREAIAPPTLNGDALPEKKVPVGCVERVLNMRERNAVIGACAAYTQLDGHKKLKDQTKLDRLKKLINWDETLEYFAMISDALEDEQRIWQRAKNQYKAWRDHKEGLVKAEDVAKMFPNLDLSATLEKPPLRPPETSLKDRRGPEAAFYLPSKIDAWVQDALRAMDWLAGMEESSVEVCAKFGIKDDDLV